MWIVAEGQDWEGDYEHIGPFDSEAEATEYAARQQRRHDQKYSKPYLKWYATELQSPEAYDKTQGEQ